MPETSDRIVLFELLPRELQTLLRPLRTHYARHQFEDD